jgi:hypothetical protein
LSPVFAPDGPDIVVNAYSANDNLPPAFHATKNTTIDAFHWVRVYERNRQFVQAAAKCSSCRTGTPLILYVNDYVGNQQESIWGEGQVDEVVQGIADYDASVAYVSTAHMVQQWVFADTSEHFFSGIWTDRNGRPALNVHFGMAGHVTALLAIAYGLLQLALDFCDFDISCHHQSPVRCRCRAAAGWPIRTSRTNRLAHQGMGQSPSTSHHYPKHDTTILENGLSGEA